MRPNTLGSLRWIAAVLLLSGCYRPWSPQQGYGYNGYGGGYPGNSGGPGIQTLTPGPYYDPNTGGTPTYSQPNNLQPQADPSISGTGSGNGAGNGGGNAPVYNPPAGRPAPLYDDPAAGSEPANDNGLVAPQSESPVKENNSLTSPPSVMVEPAPSAEWGTEPLSDRPIEAVKHEVEEKEAAMTRKSPS